LGDRQSGFDPSPEAFQGRIDRAQFSADIHIDRDKSLGGIDPEIVEILPKVVDFVGELIGWNWHRYTP
jgi:hypothetical protein